MVHQAASVGGARGHTGCRSAGRLPVSRCQRAAARIRPLQGAGISRRQLTANRPLVTRTRLRITALWRVHTSTDVIPGFLPGTLRPASSGLEGKRSVSARPPTTRYAAGHAAQRTEKWVPDIKARDNSRESGEAVDSPPAQTVEMRRMPSSRRGHHPHRDHRADAVARNPEADTWQAARWTSKVGCDHLNLRGRRGPTVAVAWWRAACCCAWNYSLRLRLGPVPGSTAEVGSMEGRSKPTHYQTIILALHR